MPGQGSGNEPTQGGSGRLPSAPLPSSDSRASNTAMVPIEAVAVEGTAQDIDLERCSFSPEVARLPVELNVMVPVRDFRVRNLLNLVPGQVIESRWGHGEDVPIASGKIPLAWSEFEVIENQLAVRITRLT